MSSAIAQDLTALAAEIDRHHQEALQAGGVALQHALACGAALAHAQQCCASDWHRWLAENTAVSVRTAQIYLRLHRNRDKLPKDETLSIRKAILAIPRATRSTAAPLSASITMSNLNLDVRRKRVTLWPDMLHFRAILLAQLGWSIKQIADQFGAKHTEVSAILFPSVPLRDTAGAEEWCARFQLAVESFLAGMRWIAPQQAAELAADTGFAHLAQAIAAESDACSLKATALQEAAQPLNIPQWAAALTDARIAIGIEDLDDWRGGLVELVKVFEPYAAEAERKLSSVLPAGGAS